MVKSEKPRESELVFKYLVEAKKGAEAISLKAELIGASLNVTVVRYGSDGHGSICTITDELREALRSHRARFLLPDGGPWYTMHAEITDSRRLLTNSSERINASWEDMLIDFAEFPGSLNVAPSWLKEAWAQEGNVNAE